MDIVWIVGGAAAIITAVLLIWLFARTRRSDMQGTREVVEKWAPPETLAATRADGEEMSLWDHDRGERIAAPFAEQIEDIVRARVAANPALQRFDFDLGTAADGGLEFWVNGQCFHQIAELPDEQLRRTVQEAVQAWESHS